FQVGRIFHKTPHQNPGHYAHGNVNVENPTPGVVECDPSAEGRSDGRRHDRSDSVQSKCQASFLWWERVSQNGLCHRLQAASASSLKNREEQKKTKAGRKAA